MTARGVGVRHGPPPPAGDTRALSLRRLPGAVQGRVEDGQLAPSVAYELSKLDDPGAAAELADRVAAEGMTRAEVVAEVKRAAGRGAGSKARAKSRGGSQADVAGLPQGGRLHRHVRLSAGGGRRRDPRRGGRSAGPARRRGRHLDGIGASPAAGPDQPEPPAAPEQLLRQTCLGAARGQPGPGPAGRGGVETRVGLPGRLFLEFFACGPAPRPVSLTP
jgi:hypothetical protein